MRSRIYLAVVLFLTLVEAQAQAPQRFSDATEKTRIERLAGLAKLWGTVKYFHPFLAYRDIDWDRALIETIPRVNAAKTSRDYEAALNSMLSHLNDKNTRAQIAAEKPSANKTPSIEVKDLIQLQDDLLKINAPAAAYTIAQANNRLNELLTTTNQAIPKAKAVLIDLRSGNDSDAEVLFYLDYYLRLALPSILDRNVALASLRYRMHNGYASQTGGGASFYYSALTTTAPQTLAGNNKAKTPPIVILINENSPAAEMLSGLQAANLAFVVQDGESAKEPGVATHTIKLPENVEVSMRTGDLAAPDGSIGFAADMIAARGEAMQVAQQIIAGKKFVSARARTVPTAAPQISQKDKPYAEMEFPNAEYRLLALFRFWNVINYFFPYKDLIDEPWDNILSRYIPMLEANKDAADYQITIRQMAGEVQDSHVGVQNTTKVPERLGNYYPPFYSKYIGGQSVVVSVFDESSGVKPGDAILSVDGVAIDKYRESHAANYSASTPQAMQRTLHFNLLRGQKDSRLRLSVRGLDGKTREIETTRSMENADAKRQKARNPENVSPVVQVLPSGFGYVDLVRLTVGEVDKMFETIKATPATIFDMRGYPQGTAWSIAPRLTEKKSPVAALFSRPILEATSLTDGDLTGVNYTFSQRLPEAKGDVYKGKVVMLINENAISQSEHTALFFETATDVTFIGTPTMGANGDVTSMVLPGNLPVSFTGHNVRHADGRQLQRIGITPTVRVEPTISGTLAGRDEILEAAIEFLRSKPPKP